MSEVSAEGLAQVQRYLLDGERAVIVTRRHWARVAEPVATAVVVVVLAAMAVGKLGDRAPVVVDVLALAAVVALLRALLFLYEWSHDWFVVTDERLLLRHGLLTQRVAVMPLSKVTDMSRDVSLMGRLLGYGEFVFESAGQDQALRNVRFLAHIDALYTALSNELFGELGVASARARRRRYARRKADQDDD